MPIDSGRCPVCASPLEPPLSRCGRCDTPHHQDCWDYLEGCAIFACATPPAPAPGLPVPGKGVPPGPPPPPVASLDPGRLEALVLRWHRSLAVMKLAGMVAGVASGGLVAGCFLLLQPDSSLAGPCLDLSTVALGVAAVLGLWAATRSRELERRVRELLGTRRASKPKRVVDLARKLDAGARGRSLGRLGDAIARGALFSALPAAGLAAATSVPPLWPFLMVASGVFSSAAVSLALLESEVAVEAMQNRLVASAKDVPGVLPPGPASPPDEP